MDRYYLNGNDWEMKDFLDEDWIWRNAEKRNTRDIRWWKQASVPSSVTYDLWKNGHVPDPYFEKNSLALEWIPQRTWVMRKSFSIPKDLRKKKLTLHFEGIDYESLIYFNDVFLGSHASMYTPVSFDITELAEYEGTNQVSVVIKKAPNEESQVSKTGYVKTHKSRMTYWWDFCPRMIHQGIWDDVYIEATNQVTVQDLYIRSQIDDKEASAGNVARADLSVQVTLDCPERSDVTVLLEASQDGITIEKKEIHTEIFGESIVIPATMTIANPKLWWPNGYGKQPLYEMKASVYVDGELSHTKTCTFGIRSVSFVKNEGAEITAKGYTACVNGKKVYIKGWNWVPMDVLYGVRREEKLKHLLTLVRDAHVNMLRIWGGGLIEREDFYQMCDAYGIMIWQEFIQSSSGIDNQPSCEPEFLRLMDEEARVIISRKRNHPSLILWCGGNELQSENGSMIRDSEPVIQVLRRAVMELDPDRYFLPSSPSGRLFNNELSAIEKDPNGLHDVHGPWEHQGLTAQYTLYNKGTSLLSSEYGVEGMTNYSTLAKSMDESHMWPPSRDNEYYFHRGSWWNNFQLIQECFGEKLSDIKTAIKASQFLQYEGLRYAVESNRRRAFHNSGSLMWQFNEPYPNNYCTCSVDYYGQPKPVYYGIQKAYSAKHISAEFDSQTLAGKDSLKIALYGHNSTGHDKQWKIHWSLWGKSGKLYAEGKTDAEINTESVFISEICADLKEITEDILIFGIRTQDGNGSLVEENRYLFTRTKNLACLLEQKPATLQTALRYKDTLGEVQIKNTGNVCAIGLKLELDKDLEKENYAYFGDNYLYLMPGEEIRLALRTNHASMDGTAVRISGFNVEYIIIPIDQTSE